MTTTDVATLPVLRDDYPGSTRSTGGSQIGDPTIITIHASFRNDNDAILAAKELITIGLGEDDIGLLVPSRHADHNTHTGELPHLIVNPGTVTSTSAALPTNTVTKTNETGSLRPQGTGVTVENSEEGVGVGALLGLLTAMCVPGIGMFVGSGAIIAGLMSGGATLGGIAGGIYGYMVGKGEPHETAKAVVDNLGTGGTTLRATARNAEMEAKIVEIIEGLGGHVMARDQKT